MEFKLKASDILEKEFKTGLRGYNQEEVDMFLDDIIQDYEAFEKKIIQLQQENKQLREELEEAPRRSAPVQPAAGATNFDILKRLSHLEKHVFGAKLYE
ncbi:MULTISPECIES: cell division regulator GpsB [unclassified Psychrobacillus]|uniref:cell division regulator GpsB n=1 Tax=unclassified Psychrobacillus TaxID=2636677 RepID=UPI00146B4324|nr:MULTISPECIES: cell division regulator GpsB [unclassified Psychrobacillus]MCM3359099.1 cell division regulator GpsB [Psychrobacillus sp. MER TA 171]NME05809.1 cell division regulator GpsB [Psychrobacillus sp. BL-248-WT-3]